VAALAEKAADEAWRITAGDFDVEEMEWRMDAAWCNERMWASSW